MKTRLQRTAFAFIAATALLVGIMALILPPRGVDGSPLSWDGLLAANAGRGELPTGFRIAHVGRGGENEVRISVAGPDGSIGAEVHVIPRGCWPGVLETTSFGVAYETPRSPAPDRISITEAVAARIGAQDRGLPPPDAIPLGAALDPIWMHATFGAWSGVLLLLSIVSLLAVPFTRSPALLGALALVAAVDVVARVAGLLFIGQPACPQGPLANMDINIRGLQALWLILIGTAPYFVWRAGVVTGMSGRRLVMLFVIAAALGASAVWMRGDEPLHANAHAWREAREALLPWGGRETGTELYLHGRAAPALAWLLAAAERLGTGAAHPFAISRIAGAAAVASCALLVAVLINSAAAGLAVGATLALMPLSQLYLVSGTPLAIAAWMIPWSLALLVAAATSGDRVLLAGAALAGTLGTMSHTAMLPLFPAIVVCWCILAVPSVRWSGSAAAAAVFVAAGWLTQFWNTYRMVALRNAENPVGLLGAAQLGLEQRNLFLASHWVSPALWPLAVIGIIAGALRYGPRRVAVPAIALAVMAIPFFAVTQCSSDAVRYQGSLLGIVTCLAVIGVWALTALQLLGDTLRAVVRIALLAPLVLLPTASHQPPPDPAAVEHRLVEKAVAQLEPGTVIVLPRAGNNGVIHEFPDFMLPEQSRVLFADDPAVATHTGATFYYLGLACVSFDGGSEETPRDLRSECAALRDIGSPWMVTSIAANELPGRLEQDVPWTYHRLATGVPFGFYRAR